MVVDARICIKIALLECVGEAEKGTYLWHVGLD